jgi:hypothetical protein
MNMPHWSIAAFTHRSRLREHNEDAVAVDAHVMAGDMDAPAVRMATRFRPHEGSPLASAFSSGARLAARRSDAHSTS